MNPKVTEGIRISAGLTILAILLACMLVGAWIIGKLAAQIVIQDVEAPFHARIVLGVLLGLTLSGSAIRAYLDYRVTRRINKTLSNIELNET